MVICWLALLITLAMGVALACVTMVGVLIAFDKQNMKPIGWLQYATLFLLLLAIAAGGALVYLKECCQCSF